MGPLSRRAVNARNGLLGKVVAVEVVDRFNDKFDRFLDSLEIEGHGDIASVWIDDGYWTWCSAGMMGQMASSCTKIICVYLCVGMCQTIESRSANFKVHTELLFCIHRTPGINISKLLKKTKRHVKACWLALIMTIVRTLEI